MLGAGADSMNSWSPSMRKWRRCSLPFHDSFTYTLPGRSWVPHEWLAEVIFAAIWGWLGWGGWLSVETSRGDAVDPGELALDCTREIGRARLTLLRRP